MEEEKKETRKEVIVLDEGIDFDNPVPDGFCCRGAYILVRG